MEDMCCISGKCRNYNQSKWREIKVETFMKQNRIHITRITQHAGILTNFSSQASSNDNTTSFTGCHICSLSNKDDQQFKIKNVIISFHQTRNAIQCLLKFLGMFSTTSNMRDPY